MLAWSIETTLMAAGLAVVAAASARWIRHSPEVRHALWFVVLARFLVPPVVAWPWAMMGGDVPVAPASPPSSIATPRDPARTPGESGSDPSGPLVASSPPLAEVDSRAMTSLGEDESGMAPSVVSSPKSEIGPLPRPDELPDPVEVAAEVVPPRPSIDNQGRDEVGGAAEVLTLPEVPPRPVDPPIDWRAALVAFWAIGSVVSSGRMARRIVRFRRAIRHAVDAPTEVAGEVAELAGRFGVKPPRVLIGRGLPTPLLWCLGRPWMILPDGLESMTIEARSSLIGHELAHLARFDHWVARLELLGSVIWWWNPLFHLARRRVRDEAELACDARVVRTLPDGRFAYAEALVLACERHARPALTLPALGIGGRSAARNLETRLNMILRAPIRPPGRWPLIVAAGMLALAAPSWTEGKQAPESPQNPKPEAATAPSTDATQGLKKPADPAVDKGATAPGSGTDVGKLLAAGVTAPKVEGIASLTPQNIAEAVEKLQGPAESLEFRVAVSISSTHGTTQDAQVKVGDFTLGRPRGTQQLGDFVRFDILESSSASNSPGPTRRFFATNAQNALSLRSALSWTGPVAMKWLGADQARSTRRDSLVSRILKSPSFIWPNDGGDRTRIGISPEALLGLAGADRLVLNPQLVQMRSAGSDTIDGVEVVRVAWMVNNVAIQGSPETHGLCWVAPSLDFAVVRLEAAGSDNNSSPPGRMSWRKESKGYRKVDGSWLPDRVEFTSTGPTPDASVKIVATFEDFQVDGDLDDDTFQPNLTLGALDPASGDFTATPPAVDPGLSEKFATLAKTIPPIPAEVPKPAPTPETNLPRARARGPEDSDTKATELRARIDEAARRLGRVRSASADKRDPAIRKAEEQLNAVVAELATYLKQDLKSEQDATVRKAIEARDQAILEVNRASALATKKMISDAEVEFARAQLAKAKADVDRELNNFAGAGKLDDASQARTAVEAPKPKTGAWPDRLSGRRSVQKAEIARAEVVRDRARINYDRQKNLAARGASSREDLDRAEGDLKLAEASVEVEKAKLAAMDDSADEPAQSKTSPLPASSTIQKAELARAEAIRDQIKGEYKRTRDLADRKIVSKGDLEYAESKLKIAEAGVEVERAKLASIIPTVGPTASPDTASAETLARIAASLGQYEKLAEQVSARYADLTKARNALMQVNGRIAEMNALAAKIPEASDEDRKRLEAAKDAAYAEVVKAETALESLFQELSKIQSGRDGDIDWLKAHSTGVVEKKNPEEPLRSAIENIQRVGEKLRGVADPAPEPNKTATEKPD